nr:MAG TPA: hypothetical protein [Caudoviricetes sp.]
MRWGGIEPKAPSRAKSGCGPPSAPLQHHDI